MRKGQLSLQQLPPLPVPMGFFRVAPWFGVLCGSFLLFAGETAWASRWTPAMLAATHILVLGCIVMVMMGALLQVLPVISSASVRLDRTRHWIRILLGGGATVLAAALHAESRWLYYVAGTCLLVAFGAYVAPVLRQVSRRVGGGDSMIAIRIAVSCLVVTVVLGVVLVAGHIAPTTIVGYRGFTSMHLGFGLIGWVSVLIMAVSFQILPMFHVAPDYPRAVTLGVPAVVPVGLVLQSEWIIGAAILVYALFTLHVLRRRKRKAPDMTVRFWQLGATVLAATVVAAWTGWLSELSIGVLFVVGFVATVMIGMLYKIVPFLVFMHLQRACLKVPSRIPELPTMENVIPRVRARDQLGLHAMTLVACSVSTLDPICGYAAALLLIADFAWLGSSVQRGQACYIRVRDKWESEELLPESRVTDANAHASG